MEKKEKDRWDKVGIILQPMGGLLAALAVAGLGFFGSQFLERRQAMETNARVYSELMSKREEAESALRKDMFVSIIQSFLKPGSTSFEAKMLNLELLAYNFHESLNLEPLFSHLERKIVALPPKDRTAYLSRLSRVAREVTRKEMLVLADSGKKYDRTIDLQKLSKSHGGLMLEDARLKLDNVERDFRILVKEVNLKTKEIYVRLEIRTLNKSQEESKVDDADFWIGFFDFPMIDNTRLSNDQRCAVILNNLSDVSAEITVVYFPGSHASLKEKPYYQEVIQNLLKTGKLMDDKN